MSATAVSWETHLIVAVRMGLSLSPCDLVPVEVTSAKQEDETTTVSVTVRFGDPGHATSHNVDVLRLWNQLDRFTDIARETCGLTFYVRRCSRDTQMNQMLYLLGTLRPVHSPVAQVTTVECKQPVAPTVSWFHRLRNAFASRYLQINEEDAPLVPPSSAHVPTETLDCLFNGALTPLDAFTKFEEKDGILKCCGQPVIDMSKLRRFCVATDASMAIVHDQQVEIQYRTVTRLREKMPELFGSS